MNHTLRNILATLLALFIGSVVNMQIITNSGKIVPYPEGFDVMKMTPETIATLLPQNFIPIFLAHALGALVAAFIACKLAISHKNRIAIVVGAFFMLGGIIASFIIQPPIWYIVVDLAFAYFPFAFAGQKLAGPKSWIGK